MYKIGLKTNAAFLFNHMRGNTLGGETGGINYHTIIYLNEEQFEQFKELIINFGGDLNKTLIKSDDNQVDYSCYIIKR